MFTTPLVPPKKDLSRIGIPSSESERFTTPDQAGQMHYCLRFEGNCA